MATPLPHPLCRWLNSKKLAMLPGDHEVCLEDLQTAGYDNYWCIQTGGDRGPDGGFAGLDQCTEARSCFTEREDAPPVG